MIAAVTPFDLGIRKALAPEPHASDLLVPVEYELLYESHTVGSQFKRGRAFYCKDDLDESPNTGRTIGTAQFDGSST